MLSIYTGFLASPEDIGDLSDAVEEWVGRVAHKADARNTSKQTWFALTGSCLHRNMYETRMPFLIRATVNEDLKQADCSVLVMSSKVFDRFQVPDCKRGGVVLLAASLRLEVTEEEGDEHTKTFLFWDPPRDFDQLRDEPPPNCYIKLFYDDLRYVSAMPGVPEGAQQRAAWHGGWAGGFTGNLTGNPTGNLTGNLSKKVDLGWARRMLPAPPAAVQRLWGSFKETFLEDMDKF